MRGQTGPPSQYTALQQLKYRMSLDKPILVSIIAPAGFGKSELLAAWQYYLMTQRLEWATLATTGVSSTTLGGATLHWFLGVDRYGESTTCNRQAEREHLTRVQGLIIDEAMMAAVDIRAASLAAMPTASERAPSPRRSRPHPLRRHTTTPSRVRTATVLGHRHIPENV